MTKTFKRHTDNVRMKNDLPHEEFQKEDLTMMTFVSTKGNKRLKKQMRFSENRDRKPSNSMKEFERSR